MMKHKFSILLATILISSTLQAQNSDSEIRYLLHLDGFDRVPQTLIDSARAAFSSDISSAAIVAYMEIPTFRLEFQADLAQDKETAEVTYSKEEQQGDYTKRTFVSKKENVDLANGFPGLKALRTLVERWDTAAHETGKVDLIAEADSKIAEVQAVYYARGLRY